MNPSPHNRREFLAKTGAGVTSMALTSLLFRDGELAAAEAHTDVDGLHHAPRAKSVIWIFLAGGVSQMESFDVKPALNKYDGMTYDQTPFKDFIRKDRVEKNLSGAGMSIPPRKELKRMQTGYATYGQSGLVAGDWFSKIGEFADDLAVVRRPHGGL